MVRGRCLFLSLNEQDSGHVSSAGKTRSLETSEMRTRQTLGVGEGGCECHVTKSVRTEPGGGSDIVTSQPELGP